MKLFNLDHSPYATRVRIQIAASGLDIDCLPPPEALRTEAFRQRFPLGKIPVLELADGVQIADSWVIMEYLEDIAPDSSLCPADPLQRAQMRALARYADTCLGPAALLPMFSRVSNPDASGDAGELLAALDEELARLERLLPTLPAIGQRSLHLGDIALAPHMAYVLMLAPMFGREQPLADYPAVAAWWAGINREEAVAGGLEEMTDAVKSFFSG